MSDRLPTDVVEARLNHLIDRARRGALLPEEADRFTTELRDLVRRLEDTEDARDAARDRLDHHERSLLPDLRRRQESDAATIKRWRGRADQAEAANQRVRDIPLEPEVDDEPTSSWDHGYNQALRATWAALDQQQPTTTDTSPYWRCAHCADPITGTDWTWAAGQDPAVSVWDKARFHADRADCQTAAGNPGQPLQPTAP
ncbi:hypothetical protein ABZ438_07865 [Streptomyces sp. NPDC005786]|uniref:hypothetical protein n=1 Tax=Streptomyces sp. NPDC005786 TaxID=3154891 RepID=UPI0033FE678B